MAKSGDYIPITWKNVTGPSNASANALLSKSGDALGAAVEGLGDNVGQYADDKQKRETDAFIAELNALGSDEERNELLAQADTGWKNLERINTSITDAQNQDFKVAERAEQARAATQVFTQAELMNPEILKAKKGEIKKQTQEYDQAELMDPLNLESKENEIESLKQEIEHKKKTNPLAVKGLEEDLKQKVQAREQDLIKFGYEGEEHALNIQKLDLSLDETEQRMDLAENVDARAKTTWKEQTAKHKQDMKNAAQNLKNAKFDHEEAKKSAEQKEKLRPDELLEQQNKTKLSAQRLTKAQNDLKEQERILKNHDIVSKQILKLAVMKSGDKQKRLNHFNEILADNKGKRIDSTLLQEQYDKELKALDVDIQPTTYFQTKIENAAEEPIEGAFSKANKAKLRKAITRRLTEKYTEASPATIKNMVDGAMVRSKYAEHFADQAKREAKSPEQKLAVEHTEQVSAVMAELDDPNLSIAAQQELMDRKIKELKSQKQPVPEKEMQRLSGHQERILETVYSGGVVDKFVKMLDPTGKQGLTAAGLNATHFSAKNKTRLKNLLREELRKTFKYVDKGTREAQITEGMQNSPDMLLGFQEQATVITEQKALTKEEAGRALRIAKKQSEKLEAMNTNRESNIRTSLMKKFKIQEDNVDAGKLNRVVGNTLTNIDALFADKNLSSTARDALNIAIHDLMKSVEVDPDWPTKNDYEIPSVEEGVDAEKLKGFQLLEGLLKHIPKESSKIKNPAELKTLLLEELESRGYKIDETGDAVLLDNAVNRVTTTKKVETKDDAISGAIRSLGDFVGLSR
jgi:hypothetical protein